MAKNKVELKSNTHKKTFTGDAYQYEGRLLQLLNGYGREKLFMICQVGVGQFAVVSLMSGNRFHHNTLSSPELLKFLNETEIKLLSEEITITISEND